MNLRSDNALQLFVYKGRLLLLEDCSKGPDAYSIFLEQNLLVFQDETVLDLATGSGFHAIMMAEKASKVVGVDILEANVTCARRNVLLNGLEEIVEIRRGDLFSVLRADEKFDLIVAWPPVMPTPPHKLRGDAIGIANEGGPDGRKHIDQIIKEAPKYLNRKGRLQVLHAWYNNVPKSLEMLKAYGFDAKVTAEKSFPLGILSFERLDYLAELGYHPLYVDGIPLQRHSVVTGWLY